MKKSYQHALRFSQKRKTNYRKYQIGQRYGKLVLIEYLGSRYWIAQCDCGKKRRLRTDWHIFRKKSCGCDNQNEKTRFKKLYKVGNAIVAKYNSYKGDALKSKKDWKLSVEQFIKLIGGDCYYCNLSPCLEITIARDTTLMNGIDRIDSAKGYTEENAVSCCFFCNCAKNDNKLSVFIAYLKHLKSTDIDFSKFDKHTDSIQNSIRKIKIKKI